MIGLYHQDYSYNDRYEKNVVLSQLMGMIACKHAVISEQGLDSNCGKKVLSSVERIIVDLSWAVSGQNKIGLHNSMHCGKKM